MTSSESVSPSVPPKRPPLDWVRQEGKVDLVLQDIAAKLRKRRRRVRSVGAVLGVCLAASLAFWAVPIWRDTSSTTTLPAQRQTLALADGSTVELSGLTDLHTDFRYGRRMVTLSRGEAFFSVAKDKGRPFFVKTPAGSIRVTGTHFDVRIGSDQRPEVTLLEGAVFVEGIGPKPVRLAPAQQLGFTDSAAVVRNLSPSDLDAVTAWMHGRLVLDHLTLAEAAARFAAYYGENIVVAPEIAGLHMGGSCRLDDLPGFLGFLSKALAVDVVLQNDGSYVICQR